MPRWSRCLASLTLVLWLAAIARADAGLLPRFESDAANIAVVVAGLALTAAVILGGFLLARYLWRKGQGADYAAPGGTLAKVGPVVIGLLCLFWCSGLGTSINWLAISVPALLGGGVWLLARVWLRRQGQARVMMKAGDLPPGTPPEDL